MTGFGCLSRQTDRVHQETQNSYNALGKDTDSPVARNKKGEGGCLGFYSERINNFAKFYLVTQILIILQVESFPHLIESRI